MRVLSTFDGMACGMLAMMAAGVEIERYVAYEYAELQDQTRSQYARQEQLLADTMFILSILRNSNTTNLRGQRRNDNCKRKAVSNQIS